MSKELVDSFYERLGQDEKMQQDYNEAIVTGLVEAAAAFATARGFDLSPDDLYMKLKSRSDELSTDELDKVAGGILPGPGSSDLKKVREGAGFRPGDVLTGIIDIEG